MHKRLKDILKSEIDPAFAKRSALIFQQIEKERPQRILDAGCGRGFYLKALSFYPFLKEIHGVDINEIYLKRAKATCKDKRIRLKNASLYSLPYPSDYFDFIICPEVLEHIKDDKRALVELRRVLKSKGTLIVTVPNKNFPFLWDPLNWILMRIFNTHIDKKIWWLAGIWADHERLYEKSELKKLLEASGFNVKKEQLLVRWCWPFSHFLLYGIGKNLVEKFGVKQFDRFEFRKKPLAKFLATLFRLPSILDSKLQEKTSVIIFMTTKNSHSFLKIRTTG